MAWLVVARNGQEYIFDKKPHRHLQGYWEDSVELKINGYEEETITYSSCILLPKGSISQLIGRSLTWDDEPFCLMDKHPYIELLFQYKNIWYCERIYLHNIDITHYEDLWDYWFSNSAEDQEPDLTFEVTANKEHGQLTLDGLYINVYENSDADCPIAVIREFGYRKSWINCKEFR